MNKQNKRCGRKIHKQRYDDGKIGSITNGAFAFLGNSMNAFSSPSITTPQRVVQTTGPLSYERYSPVDSSTEMSNLNKDNMLNTVGMAASGASLGNSIVPGVGGLVGGAVGAIGGLFGAAGRKRKLQRMINDRNRQNNATNNFNQSSAVTDNLRSQYAQDYGDTSDDVIMANGGKSPFTGDGNALVGKGETIIDGNTGNATEVQGGRGVGIDDVPADIAPEDAVLGNLLNPRTGNTFAQDAKPITRMEKKLNRNIDRNSSIIARNTSEMVHRYTDGIKQQLIQDQRIVHNSKYNRGVGRYDDGKNPFQSDLYSMYKTSNVEIPKVEAPGKSSFTFGFPAPSIEPAIYKFPVDLSPMIDAYNAKYPEYGKRPLTRAINSVYNYAKPIVNTIGNNIPNIANTLTDLAPIIYNYSKGNKPADTVNYDELMSSNPYASRISQTMAGRRYNVNPELDALNSLERRSAYNSRQLGTDAGVNRYMDMASRINLANMIGDIYGKAQNTNAQYSADYANALNGLGESYATKASASKNAAYEWNQKSKAAKSGFLATAASQLSDWNQNRRKSSREEEWMNKYFDLYHKDLKQKLKNITK